MEGFEYRLTRFGVSVLDMVLYCPPPNSRLVAQRELQQSPCLARSLFSLELRAPAQFQSITLEAGCLLLKKSHSSDQLPFSPTEFLQDLGLLTKPGCSPPLCISKARKIDISRLWVAGDEGSFCPRPHWLGDNAACRCILPLPALLQQQQQGITRVGKAHNFCKVDDRTVISCLMLSGTHGKLN